MRSYVLPAGLGVAIALAAAVFALDPGIDLAVARLFYVGRNTFVGQTPLGEAARHIAYWVPAAVFLACVTCYLARRLGWWQFWAPSGRGTIVLALSFAIGPGLLANTLFKDHSHRPRPYQTVDFGGDDAFRPFYATDGGCGRNCSFVSGEGAAAFWTLAPALLVPPPLETITVAASIAFGVFVGTLRMAFGGHYLSDTIFAALLTWSVTWIAWAVVLGRRRGWQAGAGAAAGPGEVP